MFSFFCGMKMKKILRKIILLSWDKILSRQLLWDIKNWSEKSPVPVKSTVIIALNDV